MLLDKKKIKRIIKLFLVQTSFKNNNDRIKKIDFFNLKTLFFFSKKEQNQAIKKLFFKTLFIKFSKESNFINRSNYTSSAPVKSNAELYFLDKTTSRKCLNSSIDAKFIAIPLLSFFTSFFNVLDLLKSGKYLILGFKKFNKIYIIIENLKYIPINKRTRRYIPQNFTRIGFLQYLEKKSLNTVILRWFNKLDNFEGNIKEDIDILIKDEDLEAFNKIVEEDVGIFPLDIYSQSGLPNSSYAGLPYYPYFLAENILETKILSNDGFYIPNTKYYSLSLIYHVLFHKSIKSGLPIVESDENKFIADHNYKEILNDVLLKNNQTIDSITLTNLYHILEKENFAPSYDLLLKLSNFKRHDKWYSFLKNNSEEFILEKFNKILGLSVFIIRENAFKENTLEELIIIIESFGFDILDDNFIGNEVFDIVKNNIRGGNWGKGPFKISGGEPKYYFVTYDPFYVEPTKKDLQFYPNLENRKITKLKNELRNFFNKNSDIQFNGVHSSDNFFESINYLQHIYKDQNKVSQLLKKCNQIKNEYKCKFKVIKDLSRNSSRAKVELIIFKGSKAIKKTFKNNKIDYLEREIFFLNEFKNQSAVPNLIHTEKNYIILEYLNNSVDLYNYKKISPNLIIELREVLQSIFNKNITLLDINPSNVLVCDNKIKLIDFEFATFYKEKPKNISEAYELYLIPESFKGDIPKGHKQIKDSYNLFWKNKLKLTKQQFLNVNNKTVLFCLMKVNYFIFKIFK